MSLVTGLPNQESICHAGTTRLAEFDVLTLAAPDRDTYLSIARWKTLQMLYDIHISGFAVGSCRSALCTVPMRVMHPTPLQCRLSTMLYVI